MQNLLEQGDTLARLQNPAAFAQVAVPRTFAGKALKTTTYSGMFQLDIHNTTQHNTTEYDAIQFQYNI